MEAPECSERGRHGGMTWDRKRRPMFERSGTIEVLAGPIYESCPLKLERSSHLVLRVGAFGAIRIFDHSSFNRKTKKLCQTTNRDDLTRRMQANGWWRDTCARILSPRRSKPHECR